MRKDTLHSVRTRPTILMIFIAPVTNVDFISVHLFSIVLLVIGQSVNGAMKHNAAARVTNAPPCDPLFRPLYLRSYRVLTFQSFNDISLGLQGCACRTFRCHLPSLCDRGPIFMSASGASHCLHHILVGQDPPVLESGTKGSVCCCLGTRSKDQCHRQEFFSTSQDPRQPLSDRQKDEWKEEWL